MNCESHSTPFPRARLIVGVLRDAQISASTLFMAAAAGMLVCGVLMIGVKPQTS